MAERYDIAGKVVLITGAARGIGAEAARQLYAKGAQVSLVGIEPELLEQRAAELGPRAAWFEADVTDRTRSSARSTATVERFGGIDVVIANAGIAPIGTVATIDPDDVRAHDRGQPARRVPHRACRAAARRSSAAATCSRRLARGGAHAADAHYTATKAGVEAFPTRCAASSRHTGTGRRRVLRLHRHRHGARSLDEPPAKGRARTRRGRAACAGIEAGRAIVRAIERRARRAYAPRWVPIPLALRGMLQPLLERRNHDAVEQAVRLAEAEGSGRSLAGQRSPE